MWSRVAGPCTPRGQGIGCRTLVYLFYTHNSDLIDRRPQEFTTVVAYRAPALPTPPLPDLADWACTLDPYLAIKGSTLAQEHLAASALLSMHAYALMSS